ncbi:hypothetical protein JCM21900_001122 [Sporobolomyces salmonicolor]
MDPRRLSTASLALSDDLAVYSTSPSLGLSHHGPDAYSSYAYGPAADTSFDHHALDSSFHTPSPSLGGHSRRSSVAGATEGEGKRSRARAFSLLGARQGPYGGTQEGAQGEGTGAFEGETYERAFDALEADDDSDDEGVEMREWTAGDRLALGGGATGGKAARTRFEPFEREELLWMGVSAAAVLGLTAGAVVLAFVG